MVTSANDTSLVLLQENLLSMLRGDPCLAALVHATESDCASRVALRAIAGMTDGDIRLVEEITSDAFVFTGLFLYDDDNANGDDDKNYIEPTIGSGAWVRYTDIETDLAWGMSPDSGGHVFIGLARILHAARNRGRMPFLEMELDAASFTDHSTSGGLAPCNVSIRGWQKNNHHNAGVDNVKLLLMRAARAVRNWYQKEDGTLYAPGIDTGGIRNYPNASFNFGEIDSFGAVVVATCTATVEFAYSESTLI